MATDPRRFPITLTLVTAVAFVILCGLGTWQLQRLSWKRDLLARVAALQHAPARPLDSVLAGISDPKAAEYTRVSVECRGLATAPFLQLYGIRDGEAGSRLISACETTAGAYRSILVDRGFVADTVSARPPLDSTDGGVLAITGILRAPERASFVTPPNDTAANRWFSRDIAAMAAALKEPAPAPLFLMAETPTNPEWKALVPAPLPTEISNRHLEYAGTWFGLAAALVGVYAAMLWRKWKA